MNKEELYRQLAKVETIASASKLGRLIMRPRAYLYVLGWRDLMGVREKPAVCETFFGLPMHIVLPAATDIYITKGKSHSSEIRLARFLIKELEFGDTFLDVGAHYGYFSLLASVLVGERGKVHCFEAAPSTFSILEKNINPIPNIKAINQAASDGIGVLTFHEFPTMYSEYNSMDILQYEGLDWFVENPPIAVDISSFPLDNFLEAKNISPKIFKIDVEGAELKVLKGTQQYLRNNKPLLAMEYIASDNPNSSHQKASRFLHELDYRPHAINPEGELVLVSDVETYMREQNLESDNVVYIK